MAACLGEDLSPVPPSKAGSRLLFLCAVLDSLKGPVVTYLLRTVFSRPPGGIRHFRAHRLQDPVVSARPLQGHSQALLREAELEGPRGRPGGHTQVALRYTWAWSPKSLG